MFRGDFKILHSDSVAQGVIFVLDHDSREIAQLTVLDVIEPEFELGQRTLTSL